VLQIRGWLFNRQLGREFYKLGEGKREYQIKREKSVTGVEKNRKGERASLPHAKN